MQNKLYLRGQLIKEFKKIGAGLNKKMKLYLIGGCALSLKNLKPATKDVDVVFPSLKALHNFEKELIKHGYKKEKLFTKDYKRLGATMIYRHHEKAGFDLFYRKVCGKLLITPSMVSRALKYAEFGNLGIFLFSNEDIFLFKSQTDRPRDIDDMATLIKEKGAKFDWEVLKGECERQSEAEPIEGQLYNRLIELLERYEIRAPILTWLKKRAERTMLKEAYFRRMEEGLTHKQVMARFKSEGFTKGEMRFLESLKGKKKPRALDI